MTIPLIDQVLFFSIVPYITSHFWKCSSSLMVITSYHNVVVLVIVKDGYRPWHVGITRKKNDCPYICNVFNLLKWLLDLRVEHSWCSRWSYHVILLAKMVSKLLKNLATSQTGYRLYRQFYLLLLLLSFFVWCSSLVTKCIVMILARKLFASTELGPRLFKLCKRKYQICSKCFAWFSCLVIRCHFIDVLWKYTEIVIFWRLWSNTTATAT